MNRENSTAVLTQGLTFLLKLAQVANDRETESCVISFARKVSSKTFGIVQRDKKRKLFVIVPQLLQRTDGKLAVKCLEALGTLTSFSETGQLIELLQLVECFTHSGDPRLRSTAFRIMVGLV